MVAEAALVIQGLLGHDRPTALYSAGLVWLGSCLMWRSVLFVFIICLAWQPASAQQRNRCDGIQIDVAGTQRCLMPGAGEPFKDCSDCPEMVVVPSGSFMMGSPKSEAGRGPSEEPRHKVNIARPFAVGRFEVTRGQFEAFVKATGYRVGKECWTYKNDKWKERPGHSYRDPGFAQDNSHPVVCMNWDHAVAYAAWLSKKTGKPYRLLSEAEWEYAARAGKTTPYSFGAGPNDLCRYGNVADRTAKQVFKKWKIVDCSDGYVHTAPVGSFRPNPFGLYDMHGNVWEWVADCWNWTYEGAPNDGSAWTTGVCNQRVRRGGSLGGSMSNMRSASRNYSWTDIPYSIIGFRIARTLTP